MSDAIIYLDPDSKLNLQNQIRHKPVDGIHSVSKRCSSGTLDCIKVLYRVSTDMAQALTAASTIMK